MTREQYEQRMREASAAFGQYRTDGGEEVVHDWLYQADQELFNEWQDRTQQSSTAGVFYCPRRQG